MSDSFPPLVHTKDAPVPPGGTAEWLVRPDGARLRVARFMPDGRPRGSVVLSGGRTEPIEKYFEVIDELRARGLAVVAHDWRGQGLSHRPAEAAPFEALAADLAAIVRAHGAALPRPRLALAHSMGGCLALLALEDDPSAFDGALLTAPMLGIHLGSVPAAAARAAARTQRLAGRGALAVSAAGVVDRFEGNVLTQDRARFERHRALLAACPELALGAPTWGWLDAAFHAMALATAPERLRGVTVPVTIVCAQRDTVVDRPAQRRAAHLLPRGRLVEVPGALHELLMETDELRTYVWWAFDDLLRQTASSI